MDIIYNINDLNIWINKISINKTLIILLETDTYDLFTSKIISVCLSTCTQETIYIPIKINKIPLENSGLYLEEIIPILQPILENPKIKKIGYNMKFYYTIFRRYKIELSGSVFDILLEFYTLYGTYTDHNIKKFLDKKIFNAIKYFLENFAIVNNNSYKKKDNVEFRSTHAIKCITTMLYLHKILWPKIKNSINLKQTFEEIEIPLMFVLSRIETYGVLIDRNLLDSYSLELDQRLHILEQKAYQLVKIPFNLASTKQLQEVLYKKQKLPILKKTPTGSPSTNEEVLKKLSKKYPISKIILQHRCLTKLKTTYTNKLTKMINNKSNRIHTSYNQTRTATGRLSSNNPNLQNIPSRNNDGRKIREAFIAPKNFLIVSADYSQIELRILAHISHDFRLINDFLSEKDIHAATASEIFLTKLNLVTTEQRNIAKTVNFGLIYGMSAFGLSKQLSVSCNEAQKYVDRYFKRYPGIMKYMKKTRNNVRKKGYVFTLNGRKLYLPNIYSKNITQKQSAERAAINAPIQGSAADIIKKAMILIDFWIQKEKIPVHMIMQVHDELVFEIQLDIAEFAIKKIKSLMENCYTLDVPLLVDIGIGKNWKQAH